MVKQIYYRISDEYGSTWYPLNPTGKCKKITGGPNNDDNGIYHQHQLGGRYLGRSGPKIWIHERDLKWFDVRKVEIFNYDIHRIKSK